MKKQSPTGVKTMLERNAALMGMTVEQIKSTRATQQVGVPITLNRDWNADPLKGKKGGK